MKKSIVVLTLIIALFGCKTADKEFQKPNVLFILVDDLGYHDLSFTGSEFYETPNIDRIAKEGMWFTQGYATCQVCSPSRASIMSGRFPARHGITDYIGAPTGEDWRKMERHTQMLPPEYVRNLPHEYITLPEAMKAEGYKTFFAGKWHLGNEGSYPQDHGFDINQGGYHAGGPYSGGYFSPFYNPQMNVITLSIDGPRHIHDKYRVKKNGEGSFLKLMENVNYIKYNHSHYFNNTLKINSVIAPHPGYIDDVNSFFSFTRFPSTLMFDRHSLIKANPSEKFIKESGYEDFMSSYCSKEDHTLLNMHIRGIKSFRELPTFVRSGREIKRMHFFHYRKDNPLDELDYHWPNGICIPGHKTLFVSSKGDFFPCDQMYDKNDMKIGDLQNGFSIKKIIKYLYDYIDTISPMCSTCWAIRLCSECFISVSNNGRFDSNSRKKLCKDIKMGWMNTILNYSRIIENNPHAFNYFEGLSNNEYEPINEMRFLESNTI